MLPYRFRRHVPFVALGVAAVGAAVLLLPSGQSVAPAVAVTETAAVVAEEQPSYISAPPGPAIDDIVTGSIAPADVRSGSFFKTPEPDATSTATLTVTASPFDSATATEVDAAAAAAELPMPPGDVVHVGGSAVNVRAGPTTSSRKLFVLQPGDAVSAAEVTDGWVRIVRPDGEGGWVYSRYLNGVPAIADPDEGGARVTAEVRAPETMPPKGEVRRVSGKSVRLAGPVTVRDGPSKSATRLFVLNRGERITMAEVDGGWARVVLPSGVSGWIPVR